MIGVNLVPAAILLARRRARRIRRWSVVVAGAAVMAALPIGLEIRHQARLATIESRRQEQSRQLAAQRDELGHLTAELEQLELRIDRANTLRTKRSWSGLLGLVARSLPDQVWLTVLESAAPTNISPIGPIGPLGEDQAKIVEMFGSRQLVLTGFALEQANILEFTSRLRDSAAFEKVELQRTIKEPVLAGHAVRFDLVCSW